MKTLDEICRLAAEHSTEAISKLLKRDVRVDMVNAKVKNVEEMIMEASMRQAKEKMTEIYLPVTGDISGVAILLFVKTTADKLCDYLMDGLPDASKEDPEIKNSALKELGNIVAGNFLTVLDYEIRVRVMGGVVSLAHNRYEVILEQAIADFIKDAKEGLVVEISFVVNPSTLRPKGRSMLRVDPERPLGPRPEGRGIGAVERVKSVSLGGWFVLLLNHQHCQEILELLGEAYAS